MLPRVGVLLVGGFLGAGKTTLIRRLLTSSAGSRLAVLVNEMGALGLDGELIASASETAALRTVQLDSGCLCCTLKGALGDALIELARPASGLPPAQIIVELSGAALASEVHFQVAAQSTDAPFYADGLVCVVDAERAPRWHADELELFSDQLRHADLVVLSKTDIASPARVAQSQALIAAINARAIVAAASFGDIDPARLLGAELASSPPKAAHAHTHALASATLALAGPVTRDALEALLQDASPALYRIKGCVALTDGSLVVVQCVGDQVEVAPAAAKPDSLRLIFIGCVADVARWSDATALGARLGVRAALVGGA